MVIELPVRLLEDARPAWLAGRAFFWIFFLAAFNRVYWNSGSFL
jgi:hypothetical protein